MIQVRTMSTVWREQARGVTRPQAYQAPRHATRKRAMAMTTADVLTQRLRVLAGDIIEMRSALLEGIPGAADFLAALEQQLKVLKEN